MNSIRVLAETNMKISEAKSALNKLQEEETDYLLAREKKFMSQVDKNLQESRHILEEIGNNYQGVHDLYDSTKQFCDVLVEMYGKFHKMTEDFTKRTLAWEERIKDQQQAIDQMKREVKIDKVQIENDKKSLETKKKSLNTLESHLNSRQSALENSYKVEKSIWDKIQNKK